jgi:translocation and assembly module TamA
MFGRGARARTIAGMLGTLLAAGPLAGCAILGSPARKDVDGYINQSVAFEGNGGKIDWFSPQSDYRLRQQIENQDSPFGTLLPILTRFTTPEVYDPNELVPDGYRLEVWYAHHGWFDARVSGWEVRQVVPRTRRKAGAVELTAHLETGERSSIRSFEITGLKGASEGIGRLVERTGYVQEGEPFDLEAVQTTRDMLRDRLRDQSYAYADVSVDMAAYPADHVVDVTLVARPGVSANLGPITVGGEDAIDAAVILDELELEEGDEYSQQDLVDARNRLLQLRTFSVVAIQPDLTDPSRKDVPLHVEVTETKFQTVRLGGGVDYDGIVLTPRVSASYEHVNLFSELIRLQTRAEAGYAANFGASLQQAVPVGELGATISHPRLFGSRRFGGLVAVEAERGLQSGQFTFLNPRADASVTWQPRDEWLVTAGPHAEIYQYQQLSSTGELIAKAVFGEGFQNPYRLFTIDADFTADERDDPFAPTRGRYYSLGVRQSVPFSADDFFYAGFHGEYRTYKPFRLGILPKSGRSTIIAARARGQVLQPWDDEGDLPFPERAFLGGPTELRGFRDDGVGPYACLCVYDAASDGDAFTGEPLEGQDLDRQYISQGGFISGLVSLEARQEFSPWFSAVGFADFGMLLKTWREAGFDRLRTGYGVGIRYQTGIGPFRVDFAFRPLYPEDWGPTEYVNCQQEDRLPRAFDLFSLPAGNRDLFDRSIPFAFNLYLGLGEAI